METGGRNFRSRFRTNPIQNQSDFHYRLQFPVVGVWNWRWSLPRCSLSSCWRFLFSRFFFIIWQFKWIIFQPHLHGALLMQNGIAMPQCARQIQRPIRGSAKKEILFFLSRNSLLGTGYALCDLFDKTSRILRSNAATADDICEYIWLTALENWATQRGAAASTRRAAKKKKNAKNEFITILGKEFEVFVAGIRFKLTLLLSFVVYSADVDETELSRVKFSQNQFWKSAAILPTENNTFLSNANSDVIKFVHSACSWQN